LLAANAHADADDVPAGDVIFARGASLMRTDARGHGETEIATLPEKAQVRALRTDATGSVLLANVDGAWSWLPLDGSTKTLASLPCADGPAQLAEDGACVLCRAKSGSVIVNLATGKTFPVDAPAPGTRIAGVGTERKLIWADKDGVWSASPGAPKQAKKVAPDAPLRDLLPSPDGGRAVGVYRDEVYTDSRHKKPGDLLMSFALDGTGARRKGIKDGIPVEWSHDSQYLLVQDGTSACLMRAPGGQYKCWKGYTAQSVAPDGSYALILGNRDGSKKQTKAPAKKPPADDEPAESDAENGPTTPDVPIPPPTGPLALFRAELAGPFTNSPVRIVKVVDGAAVWVPAKP
jgi:hypothetical protein